MSNVVLRLHPGAEPVSWTEFCETHPRFSIALDGYVRGISRYDARGPWLTLDHHADVDRLAARATCAQVLLCIRQGLFDAFQDEHGQRATVYANDCDEDVCLSWFLLQNPQVGCLPSHTRLNRLVQAVDVLDTTAGASLHTLDRALISELAWIFAPYRQARMQGALDGPLGDLQSQVIAAVTNRIGKHLMDKGGIVSPDTRFQRIGGGNGWSMVREIGAQARTGMVEAGIRAYVSVRRRADGAWTYAIGRVSPFVPFDVLAILRELNAAEDPQRGTWGGGNLVGGSPRLHGSELAPDEVSRIVGRVLARPSPKPGRNSRRSGSRECGVARVPITARF
jgi:hypothetical protein